ncbi:MAG: 2-C-methyl-D-erythritol 2,4-cyclodiphosphate synthase [Acidimicrobiales bacterium]|jgi:2-C-methyl-D-erythritol 2,4-cyclodiphosphate synthase
MTKVRVGIGFDQHAFVASAEENRPLVLGGVTFDAERGLRGHSDADVVAHAVADAMLGAASLGDLGAHFPDSDPRWADADSLTLLARVASIVKSAGLQLSNADCTVICENPRIGRARENMMERLSAAASGPVHVKATRPEGLGSLGRGEGIACLATALLEEIGS